MHRCEKETARPGRRMLEGKQGSQFPEHFIQMSCICLNANSISTPSASLLQAQLQFEEYIINSKHFEFPIFQPGRSHIPGQVMAEGAMLLGLAWSMCHLKSLFVNR